MTKFKDILLAVMLSWLAFCYLTRERVIIGEVQGLIMAEVHRVWVWER